MSEGGRAIPNTRVRRLMLAIQDVMGQSGLATILRQANLQRFSTALPPANGETGLHAAEYASLMQAIENYYGRGGRGTLTRVGYASFGRLVASRPFAAAAYRLLFKVLPLQSRQMLTLRWLGRELAGRGGRVSVYRDDSSISLVDHESDATVGRHRDSEICWETVGEIQEALKWGTGLEFDVNELSCKAKGDAACRFEIGDPLSWS
jgi:predicted hydrocarbon binding protein